MNRYRTVVDRTVPNSTYTILLDLVGPDKDVLDVGCSSGHLAEALVGQGCRVSGIELDEESAREAQPFLERLVVGDLNRLSLFDEFDEFGESRFDAIVFADVLEHLVEPLDVLRRAVALLRPGGTIAISIPNVAHGSLRLALLQGRWRSTETGLLDATHLRFFTKETLLDMVASAGLHITTLRATILDPLGTEVQIADDALPGAIVDWVRREPESFVYQYVLSAVVGPPREVAPDTVPAVAEPVIEDIHAERGRVERAHAVMDARLSAASDELGLLVDAQRDEIVEMTRRMEILRDEIRDESEALLLAESRAALSRDEASSATARANRADARADSAVRELATIQVAFAAANSEITAMRNSRSWRLGQNVLRPFATIRRLLPGAGH